MCVIFSYLVVISCFYIWWCDGSLIVGVVYFVYCVVDVDVMYVLICVVIVVNSVGVGMLVVLDLIVL